MKNTDLRVIKTKKALSLALLNLLEQKNFSSISVNDICIEALVGRSTFYLHFCDKYDLLDFSMNIIKQQLFADNDLNSMEAHIRNVFTYVKNHAGLFKNLLSSKLDVEIVEVIRNGFYADIVKLAEEIEVSDTSSIVTSDSLEVVSLFYASGITSTLMFWVSKGFPYSTEEMAHCVYELLPHA